MSPRLMLRAVMASPSPALPPTTCSATSWTTSLPSIPLVHHGRTKNSATTRMLCTGHPWVRPGPPTRRFTGRALVTPHSTPHTRVPRFLAMVPPPTMSAKVASATVGSSLQPQLLLKCQAVLRRHSLTHLSLVSAPRMPMPSISTTWASRHRSLSTTTCPFRSLATVSM